MSLCLKASSAVSSRVATRATQATRPVTLPVSRPVLRAARHAAASPASRKKTVTRVIPMEVAQLADEGGFIAGVAGTMWAMTLVGLAIGFILLRFEALVEDERSDNVPEKIMHRKCWPAEISS